MFRTSDLVTLGFPLLIVGCRDNVAPLSGSSAEPPKVSRASATTVSRFQVRGVSGSASFTSFDPSGCVLTGADIYGAEEARKEGPGKPTPEPLAGVFVFQENQCTGEELRSIVGTTRNATFHGDRSKLAEAHMKATIPAIDDASGAELQVVVEVTWTGTGETTSQTERFRFKQPGSSVSGWSKGTFREAVASGTVAIDGENLTLSVANFAEIVRARAALFEVMQTR